MFGTIIPETFAGVLTTYATCFQARSYPTFQWLVLGWVQCLERRTLTAQWYAQEYECAFVSSLSEVFDRDTVLSAFDERAYAFLWGEDDAN